MTKEEARQNAEVMMAYTEGKTIQIKSMSSGWIDCPHNSNPSFEFNFASYRIKPTTPTPTYRPWKSEEVPVGALITGKGKGRYLINGIAANGYKIYYSRHAEVTINDLLDDEWTYSTDQGKTWQPCGVLE